MSLYRGMDRAALDAAYDNAAAVGGAAHILADWEKRSDALASEHAQHLDLRYGPRERNRLDYLSCGRTAAPILVFIHGGYWQMRAKENFRFVAAGPLAHAIDVVLIGYTLAPEATLGDIVEEARAAIAWVAAHAGGYGGDSTRLYVSGWSAGGHLTAMCLREPAVKGGLAISGIFDLEPIRLCYLNDKLGLNAEEARRLSPLLHVPPDSAALTLACGGGELPELQRQSEEFAAARARAGLPGRFVRLAGHNHFTLLEELAHSDGALTTVVRELVDV